MDISNEEKTSYVRTWAKKKEKEARYINELNPDLLFGGIVYGISGFGDDWQDLADLLYDELPDEKQYAGKPYFCDSSAFEIGCYFYVNIDMWLFDNKPEMREQLSGYLYQQFVNLFSEALPVQNVHELFVERIDKYGELFRNEEDMKTILFYLTELIKRTKYDTPPQRADFDNFKLSIDGGLSDEISLKTNLMTFLTCILPATIEIVENYVSVKEEEKPVNYVSVKEEKKSIKDIFKGIGCLVLVFGIMIGIISFLTYLQG